MDRAHVGGLAMGAHGVALVAAHTVGGGTEGGWECTRAWE